jgi:hypothetical protein
MTTTRNRLDGEPVTLDRLERGLALMAYLVALDGEVLVPLFEKLERDLEAMRSNQDTITRARKLAESTRLPAV